MDGFADGNIIVDIELLNYDIKTFILFQIIGSGMWWSDQFFIDPIILSIHNPLISIVYTTSNCSELAPYFNADVLIEELIEVCINILYFDTTSMSWLII